MEFQEDYGTVEKPASVITLVMKFKCVKKARKVRACQFLPAPALSAMPLPLQCSVKARKRMCGGLLKHQPCKE
jgi:hypothetical protein